MNKIKGPGIYTEVSDKEYFALDAMSQSALKPILETPRKAKDLHEIFLVPSESMIWGSCLDHMVTGLRGVDDLKELGYVFDDGGSRRTKKYKEWKASIEEAGKTPIPYEWREELDTAESELLAHRSYAGPSACDLLGIGPISDKDERYRYQVVVVWVRKDLGLCKAKYDVLSRDFGIVDLKTTQDASPEGFTRSISKFGYHIQAAWYLEGLEAVTGQAADFWIVASQNKPPYRVEVGKMDLSAIEVGRTEIRCAVKRYTECKKEQQWPNTSGQVQSWELPRWHKTRRIRPMEKERIWQ